jgi:UDP-N-acetylmuramoylalanine--D-glutamate ligase
VLLSPACASYDQYRSFEERGDHFKALVGKLSAHA